MGMTGHADDCPACAYDALPDEDKAALDPAAFTRHARREPPVAVNLGRSPFAPLALAGLIVALAGFLMGSVLVGVLGLALFLPAGVKARGKMADQHEADESWRLDHRQWREEQTTAWLAARASGDAWPCPTCGQTSCSSQHSVTTTTTVRVGSFYRSHSHSDPV